MTRPSSTSEGASNPIGIVVVNFGSHEVIERNLGCVDLTDVPCKVVVIDNFSTRSEASCVADLAHRLGWEFVPLDTNAGFGCAVNIGVARATDLGCRTLLILNPDASTTPEVIDALRVACLIDRNAMMTPVIERPDGSIWFDGGRIGVRWGGLRSINSAAERQGLEWATGACLAMHVEMWEKLGGFDNDYYLYWEDVDLSFRCQQLGGRIVVRADLRAVHEVGATQGHMRKSAVYNYYNCRNRLVFAAKHLALRYQLIWILQIPMDTMRVLSRGGRAELLHAKRVLAPGGRGVIDGLRWMSSNTLRSGAKSPARLRMRSPRSIDPRSTQATVPLRRAEQQLRHRWASLLLKIRGSMNLFANDPVAAIRISRLKLTVLHLAAANRFSRRGVTGSSPVVVSITTHGFRARHAYLAIESISRGSIRPQRTILWIDDDEILKNLPSSLRRLERRGLEILKCEDFGPHKKQYPFAASISHHDLPLATADDDVFYPRRWLEGLMSAHAATPEVVVGYRAHYVAFEDGALLPYATWPAREGNHPSYRVFCTGVSGILYPPGLLDAIREEGPRFMEVCPRADDVWLHFVSVRHGYQHRQILNNQAEFATIPATQIGTLYSTNVVGGGNDTQVSATYGQNELQCIVAAS
jgi:GT2 family glycosyltransferase